MILLAAGDAGGSRALLPLLPALQKFKLPFGVVEHGFLGAETPAYLRDRLCPAGEAASLLLERGRVLVWASSNNDSFPLSLARLARDNGIPGVHVLDNWANYKSRLETDGLEPCYPDAYVVMDAPARAAAVAEGIPPEIIHVLGHPAFAAAAPTRPAPELEALRNRAGGRQVIGFVCEGYEPVYGSDLKAAGHPGFTELTVLRDFAALLRPHADRYAVVVLAHPRNSLERVQEYWDKVRGPLTGTVLKLRRAEDLFAYVDGVAGMASILLYSAWLVGMPVLSLLHDCRLEALRRYAQLKNVHCALARNELSARLAAWLDECRNGTRRAPPEEAGLNAGSPEAIARLIKDFYDAGALRKAWAAPLT